MSDKIKKNGKQIGKYMAAAALTALFVFNVAFTLEFNNDSFIPDVKLTFLTNNNEAFASGSGSVQQQRDPDDDSCYYWPPGALFRREGTYINCEVGTLWCVESECS